MAFTGPTEAWLEEIMRGQRREAGGERSLATPENADDRGLEIVVREPRGTPAKWARARTCPSRKLTWSGRS
jgi:hypothetical protein